MTTRPLRLDS